MPRCVSAPHARHMHALFTLPEQSLVPNRRRTDRCPRRRPFLSCYSVGTLGTSIDTTATATTTTARAHKTAHTIRWRQRGGAGGAGNAAPGDFRCLQGTMRTTKPGGRYSGQVVNDWYVCESGARVYRGSVPCTIMACACGCVCVACVCLTSCRRLLQCWREPTEKNYRLDEDRGFPGQKRKLLLRRRYDFEIITAYGQFRYCTFPIDHRDRSTITVRFY